MAVDIAKMINYNYNDNLLVIPEAKLTENLQTVIGIDGRKMSKSYNNTIPLFLPPEKLRKLIMKIVTNSQSVEEPKNEKECNIFTLYKLFATKNEQTMLANKYAAGGMGWGEAKQILFEKLNKIFTPIREKYEDLISNWEEVEKILQKGEEKARDLASDKLKILRKAIGIIIKLSQY